jgi:hypothetical protein
MLTQEELNNLGRGNQIDKDKGQGILLNMQIEKL